MRHSTKSYSEDLRQRVVSAYLSGLLQQEVADRFSVSIDSVRRWVKRYRQTGRVDAKQRGGRKPSKITDMAKFEAFAKAHAHCTLKQMKEKWEGDVSEMCISLSLIHI